MSGGELIHSEDIPQLHHVIQSYDTAFLKKKTADYSAITTWGVFYPSEDQGANLILLDAIKGRYEFPELRRLALEQYKYWQPESDYCRAKASGLPLNIRAEEDGYTGCKLYTIKRKRQARTCECCCTFVRIWYDMGS